MQLPRYASPVVPVKDAPVLIDDNGNENTETLDARAQRRLGGCVKGGELLEYVRSAASASLARASCKTCNCPTTCHRATSVFKAVRARNVRNNTYGTALRAAS